jgi:acetyl esterase/lipase
MRKYFQKLILLLILVLVTGCKTSRNVPIAPPTLTPLPPNSTDLPTDTPPPTDTSVPPTNTPIPPTATETLTHTSSHTNTPETIEKVDLATGEGLNLAGWLYHPTGSPKKPIAVILAHQLSSSHFEWRSFAELLTQQGYTTLVFDFRGQRRSQGVQEFSKVGVDVEAAICFLKLQVFDRIVCMGASMGGSGCLAASIKGDMEGFANLSGPQNIPKTLFVTDEDMANLTIPKLFMDC